MSYITVMVGNKKSVVLGAYRVSWCGGRRVRHNGHSYIHWAVKETSKKFDTPPATNQLQKSGK